MRSNALILWTMLVFVGTGCASESGDWAKAKEADTIAAYETYLQEHPEGEHAANAAERRSKLQSDDAWDETRTAGTAAAYLDYLDQYPQSDHSSEAKTDLERILYSQCVDGGDWETCDDYLRLFEGSERFGDVQRQRRELAFDLAVGIGTVDAYVAFVAAYPDQDQFVTLKGGLVLPTIKSFDGEAFAAHVNAVKDDDTSVIGEYSIEYGDIGGNTHTFRPDARNTLPLFDLKELGGKKINTGHLANILYSECFGSHVGMGIGQFYYDWGRRSITLYFFGENVSAETRTKIKGAHTKEVQGHAEIADRGKPYTITCTLVLPS